MISDEPCPVSETLLGRLYDCSKKGVADLVSDLSSTRRGELALFCYRRAHFRDLGVAIAATCDLTSLVDAGGKAGNFLFDLSREAPKVPESRRGSRQARITLPTMPTNWRPLLRPAEETETERQLVVALNSADEPESAGSVTLSWDMP
jgi:hypothetical protein